LCDCLMTHSFQRFSWRLVPLLVHSPSLRFILKKHWDHGDPNLATMYKCLCLFTLLHYDSSLKNTGTMVTLIWQPCIYICVFGFPEFIHSPSLRFILKKHWERGYDLNFATSCIYVFVFLLFSFYIC
jgi:hypothetical protein